MIGKIKGKLIEVENNQGLIETSGGVFYLVHLTPSIIKNHDVGKNIEVYTYLQVREDALTLYGFENKKKYQLFQMLLGVDGVGPKSGFNIVSFTDSDSIFDAARANNVNFFSSIPGIGKKTAQKILLELSSKIGSEFDISAMTLSADDLTVVDALVSLGFKRSDSHSILSKLDKKLSVEEKIREAIKLMTKK